jgi:AbrB family looped-hinge helix DNA binding protein
VGKITSKYQVSIPKALADRLGVRPGDEIDWHLVGEELRVTRLTNAAVTTVEERLRSFDEATRRQIKVRRPRRKGVSSDRGWSREELYGRGRTR